MTLSMSFLNPHMRSSECGACLWEERIRQASFRLAICIAMAMGMRRGEIFALTWADFNELSLRIAVSKAMKADGSLGEPKSESSVRIAEHYSEDR